MGRRYFDANIERRPPSLVLLLASIACLDLSPEQAKLRHQVYDIIVSLNSFGTGEKVILIVEDDHAAYVLLELGFNEIGGSFRVYRVENGWEALYFLHRSAPYTDVPRPDLILLDLNMPGLNGFDVLHAMKDHAELSAIPVVVLTSSRSSRDREKSLELGARAFVTKASDIDEFLNSLRDVCSFVGTSETR